ncbi:MAG: ATP-binding protein [Gammaproteobacteria bacterium]|nr:ATP-binding protein [Gammaproteobacteria bacterium]
MNEKLFPKPSPADPMPLERWLRGTDRAESGREAFFRGRDDEYRVFQGAVLNLRDNVIGGGTMIFQGSPGAGKTALMQECMEAVRQHSTFKDPWIAVLVDPSSLKWPDTVVRSMVSAANAENERLLNHASDRISAALKNSIEKGRQLLREIPYRDISVSGASLGKKESAESPQGLFQHVQPLLRNYHIVVFVDEAQNAVKDDMTKGVIDCLHRNTQGIPLVTAFFGLSDTEEVLSGRGLSRPPDERVVNLELLSHEESSEVVKGVFEAYGFSGSGEEREIWVERLAELSQGWPQHINRVAVAASRVIVEHGGKIRNEWLEQALHNARDRKEDYYRMILRRCSGQSWIYKQLVLAADQNDGLLNIDQILNIAQYARTKSGEPVKDFLTDALHAGVLMESRDNPGSYHIPIPSLGDYLRKLTDNPPPDIKLTWA